MMKRRRRATVIAEGLKIAGNVSAEGFVEVHGEIEGELHCTSLQVSEKGQVDGKIIADDVVVNGTVNGPINGAHVALQSKARLTGDVHHESFSIEKGAFFAGRSIQKEKPTQEKLTKLSAKKIGDDRMQKGSVPKDDKKAQDSAASAA